VWDGAQGLEFCAHASALVSLMQLRDSKTYVEARIRRRCFACASHLRKLR
jgi:hypothetical protein